VGAVTRREGSRQPLSGEVGRNPAPGQSLAPAELPPRPARGEQPGRPLLRTEKLRNKPGFKSDRVSHSRLRRHGQRRLRWVLTAPLPSVFKASHQLEGTRGTLPCRLPRSATTQAQNKAKRLLTNYSPPPDVSKM